MSPSQRFHLPHPLRKTKTPTSEVPWAASGSDNMKIVGFSATDSGSGYDTRSLSVATTAYETRRAGLDYLTESLPIISVSKSSTEPFTPLKLDLGGLHEDLDKKPSSLLLRDQYQSGSPCSGSSKTMKIPRDYGSSSTLHSHYEAQKVPSSISQQTSESSARDGALRKNDSSPSVNRIRLSESLAGPKTHKQTKPSPSRIDISTLFPQPRSSKKPERSISNPAPAVVPRSSSPVPSLPAAPKVPNSSGALETRRLSANHASIPPISRHRHLSVVNSGLANIKVNIRRPKAGLKNWFDDLGEDSSDEDHHEEPDLKETFVEGLTTVFGEGQMWPRTSTDGVDHPSQTFLHSPATLPLSDPSLFTRFMPVSPDEPGRRLTLDIPDIIIPAEDPVCFPTDRPLRHQKSCRMDEANLNEQSVLYLSSSEDEEDDVAAKPPPRGTTIRDSLAVESIVDLDIEIGTAQAVSKSTMLTRPPRLKRFKSVLNQTGDPLKPIPVPLRRSSRMLSYLSDVSSDSLNKRTQCTTPSLTPIEGTWPESKRSSVMSGRGSTRLMNVTKQEEILLAQMRLKRAELRDDCTSALDRWRSSANRSNAVLHQPRPKPSRTGMNMADYPDHGVRSQSVVSNSTRFRESTGSEDFHQLSGTYSRASVTTFQTNRASATTFQTESTRDIDMDMECSSSPTESHRSPTTPPYGSGQNAASERTGSGLTNRFTSSSEERAGHSRARTDSSHIIVLDELDKPAARDTRSQDFIEWPYSGWQSIARLAVVH